MAPGRGHLCNIDTFLVEFNDYTIYPGVSLSLCCFVVCSSRQFVYVLPCVILFLCFSVLLALQLPRLGKRELILVHFVHLFDLHLFGFVCFLFLLVYWKGCGL